MVQKKDTLYKYIKELFFDFVNSKWKFTDYKKFVEENNLKHEICYSALNDIFNSHIKFLPKHKGFIVFLNQIKKLNGAVYIKKISMIEGLENEGLGEIIDVFKKYSHCTLNQCFDLIDNNLNSGLTKSTIRSYYFQEKLGKNN